ncbi:MAG: tetratricopeptide repeat protein, partial [Deltaproteobacteria bacterium]|nr:tetratricopeptide repeat protein [Deltaproteobacteria bacterium]
MKIAAAAAIALCAQHATAPADDNKARPDALYEKANAQFKAGQYQGAVRDFRAAYDLVRDPVYLFNLAQAYRKLLDCLSADDF